MVWIFGLGFGCLALFFILRRLYRHQTSFEVYRKDKEAAHSRAEKALHRELLTLPPSETLAPVAAGVREMLALHGVGAPCVVTTPDSPARVCITLPDQQVLTIQYRMRPTGYTRSGCYWEIAASLPPDSPAPDSPSLNSPIVCRNLNDLMHRIETQLVAAGCMEHPLI